MTNAIDIRAQTFCSLGRLITGNLADTYAQNSGLIFTRGSVELDGIYAPPVGTKVSFAYAKAGFIARLPRTVRVLSSFADPFRRKTTVQLGCLLTYLENRKPPVEDPNSKEENGDVPCYVFGKATLPISAKYVVEQILSTLGITSDTVPLTNVFSVEKFDLSFGFIQVLSDLIVSEGYIGYLDEGEVLRYRDLAEEVSAGPLIDNRQIIDLSPIGVGDLPGDAVIVNYSSRRLKPPEELSNDQRAKRNWEYEETFGSDKPVSVTYTPTNGTEPVTVYGSYKPYNFTATTYDGWDRAVERLSYEQSSVAEVNNRWASDLYKNGIDRFTDPAGRMQYTRWTYAIKGPRSATTSAIGDIKAQFWSGGSILLKTLFDNAAFFDAVNASECLEDDPPEGYEEVTSELTQTFISEAEAAGTLNLDTYAYTNSLGGTTVVSFSTAYTNQESQTLITYEKDEASGITKTKTETYLMAGKTTSAQQDLAARVNNPPDTTGVLFEQWIDQLVLVASQLRSEGVEVRIRTEREYGLQRRPSQQDRNNSANTKPEVTDQKAAVTWVTGSTESTNYIEFTLPYAPDDKISWTLAGGYTSTPSDAGAKALRFGRIQNRLLLGNRNGLSLQLPPETMPPRPFDPLYVQADGLVGQYRVNACSWSFDSSGIVASADCLFWGAPA